MTVRFHSKFLKDLDKLKGIQLKLSIEQLIASLQSAKDLREIPDIKKLKGSDDAYRIKLGTYRVCFFYNKQSVDLARVLPRKDVYKYFP
ncbi:MAG: addiction module toxin, RelE/StbE family [Bacteroidota bacterium]|nr:addiction module toxin, RelE/StbE family [Bacteroidota bacterium]